MTLMELIDNIELKLGMYGYGSAPYKEARTAVVEAVEKLERDAARYRWLRENHAWLLLKHFPANKPYVDAVEVIDAAIDAAMKEATNGQGT